MAVSISGLSGSLSNGSRLSLPLAVFVDSTVSPVVSESTAVSKSGVSVESMSGISDDAVVSVSKTGVSISVVGISRSLRLGLSLPLAVSVDSTVSPVVSESMAVSESGVSKSTVSMVSGISETGVSVSVVGISLSLGEGNGGQAGNKDGFNHLGLFLH